MNTVNKYRAALLLAIVALVTVGSVAVATTTPVPIAKLDVAATSTFDPLNTAKEILAGCQAGLLTPPPLGTAQRIRLQTCVMDYTQRIIPALESLQSPSPTPTSSPSATPSSSPTVGPTTTSPTSSPTPSATPTPTPIPSPTPTIAGGFPDASNSGVPAGTTLLPWSRGTSGNDSVSNATFDSVDLPVPAQGFWKFSGSNLTFRNCLIHGGIEFDRSSNIRLDHCTVLGGTSWSGTQGGVIVGNDISRWDDAIHITSDSRPVTNITVADNFVHAPLGSTDVVNGRSPTVDCNAHMDAIQLLGVNGITIMHNTLDLGPWFQCRTGGDVLNGALQIESTQGPDLNMDIRDNYLNGGGYTARFYQCTATVFQNNTFGTNWRYGFVDPTGRCVGSTPAVWSGNVVAGTNPPQVVSAP